MEMVEIFLYLCINKFTKMVTIRREKGKVVKEYGIWKAMKARCYAPSNSHLNYQKNNIKVCERWINSFENFIEDMGKCSNKYSLDRIDNLGDYSPENCRWADTVTQGNNKGDFNIVINYNNESHTLKQWSVLLNIKYTTLYLRLFRNGLSFEEAIKLDPYNKLIFYKGEKKCLKDWCNLLNLPYQNMVDRKHKGWSVEDAFEKPIRKIKI